MLQVYNIVIYDFKSYIPFIFIKYAYVHHMVHPHSLFYTQYFVPLNLQPLYCPSSLPSPC